MLAAITIVFRESLEMLIVIVSLLTYINRTNKKSLFKYILAGSVIGALTSVALGAVLLDQLKNLEGMAKQVFEGTMSLFVAGLIAYNIVWMGRQKQISHTNVEKKYKFNKTAFSLFILSFLTVFRESLEIIIFLLAMLSESSFNIVMGIVIGILISFAVMFIIYKTAMKLSINIIFDILTVTLIYIGALMFGEGLAALTPSGGTALETSGYLVYGIPALYIFLKYEIKKYLKK